MFVRQTEPTEPLNLCLLTDLAVAYSHQEGKTIPFNEVHRINPAHGSVKTVSSINETVLQVVHSNADLPDTLGLDKLASFLHQALKPYEDSEKDIQSALDYVFEQEHRPRGFLVLATDGATGDLVGAAVVHFTPWRGYVPENLLLFIAVDTESRGRGIGRSLLDAVVARCEGDIKLHVEHDNPAKRLYERAGFTSKYAEMRLTR